jgi:hypothetical protein
MQKKLDKEGRVLTTSELSKYVSVSWELLSLEEREEWRLRMEEDRIRYEAEKSNYNGPWKIPAPTNNVSSCTDDGVPAPLKRPMSAFVAFSNDYRPAIQYQHPNATDENLSEMLSKSWKLLNSQESAKYMEQKHVASQVQAGHGCVAE